VKKSLKKVYKHDGDDRLLPKLSLFIFDRSRVAAVFWLCLTLFGALSYTTFLKREGFPSISIPYAVISGSYIVNDAAKVDGQVAKPLSDIAMQEKNIKSVQTQSQNNQFNVVVQFKDGTNVSQALKDIQQKAQAQHALPAKATVKYIQPKMGFTERGDDAVVSVYAKKDGTDIQAIAAEGDKVAAFIKAKHLQDLQDVSVVDPFITGKDSVTDANVIKQTNFDRYGARQGDSNNFYNAVAVGVTQVKGADVLKLDDKLRAAVDEYNRQNTNSNYVAVVSASYAPGIRDQISQLQRSLIEGLIAVLIIGSLVIAIRASIITVISMLTVLTIALGVLYLIGYSLNTITLFSLILCMGLIVDDTIIMVEAIDAQRRRRTDPRETIHVATRKVSRAMIAATSTAALSFAPLLFVGGILGSFIRAIPVTVITSLVTSLLVALIFIPLFARYLLLGKKQMGSRNVHEPAAGIEARIARFIGKPMLWAQHSKKRLFTVGIIAVIIGFSFVASAGIIFKKVTFNIFPPSKDSNGLSVSLSYDPGLTVQQAEKSADQVDSIVGKQLGVNFQQASYNETGNTQQASLSIDLLPYSQRKITAPELVKQLDGQLKQVPNVQVKVAQQDVGPPASAFTVRIQTSDRTKAMALAKDLNQFMLHAQLKRPDGSIARITTTSISDPDIYQRDGGNMYIEVTGNFNADDTSTLVTLAKSAVQKQFTDQKIESYGLPKSAIVYDFGQESDNQNSFKTLAIAFPVLLFVIYLLLALQFRSLAQPLLIFMAIPFSLFGITLGLYLTDNAFSFFAMLGFFALIGLSLKNSILLTDYANQLRRDGASAVDAAVEALGERFRPLVATSLTAVVSLIPLFLSSPFWEGLTTVLICGLLSSTLLVILVFPYYYLGAEYLRLHVSRKACISWIIVTILGTILLSNAGLNGGLSLLISAIGFIILGKFYGKFRKRRAV
jgi:multidrug efflux pump subunit AcrB